MRKLFSIKVLTVICLLLSILPISAQKIGISMANQYAERWIKETRLLNDELKQLGAEVLIETADDNVEKQIAQSQKLINSGVKVLIVVSVNCAASAKIVEAAHKAGVKVIAYDRLILNSDLDYYVSFNSVIVGELLAGYVLKLRPSGNYMFIDGPLTDFNSKLIREGVMKVLDKPIKQGTVKLVFDKNLNDWAELESYMETSAYLNSKNPKPDAVITGADLIGIGAANALEESKLIATTLVVGQDADLQACKGIVNGKYSATLLKSSEHLAKEIAQLAYKVAKGEALDLTKLQMTNNGKTDVPSLLLEPVLIDKSNIDKEIIQSGHLSKEQVYGK